MAEIRSAVWRMWQVVAVPRPLLKSERTGSQATSPAATTTGAPFTTEVCADEELLEPTLFDAVTATRRVEPTSPPTSVYEVPVAPVMSAQPAPPPSQRRH